VTGPTEKPFRPTGETALVIVPPPDVCGFADHYRALYMPDKVRTIEPHVTIVYPFVPYDRLPEAEPRLREALSHCPPTRLSLRGFRTFPADGVLYLYLANEERVHSIYRAVLAAFPEYPAYEGKHGDQWIPHMTVGIFTDRQELERVHSDLAIQNLYIGFDVEQVTVKAEMDDGIWDTWAEIPLLGEEKEN
jgi:2'-5' RNA ligase